METDEKRHARRYQRNSFRLLSYGPKDIILSKDWTARGTVQRVGASVFATILLLGSIALLLAGFLLWAQVSNAIAGTLGQMLGALLALLPFFIAYGLTFFAVRLIRGICRSLQR